MRAVTIGIIAIVGLAAVLFSFVALGHTLDVLAAARLRSGGEAVLSGIIAVVFWLIAAGAAFAAIRLFQQRRGR